MNLDEDECFCAKCECHPPGKDNNRRSSCADSPLPPEPPTPPPPIPPPPENLARLSKSKSLRRCSCSSTSDSVTRVNIKITTPAPPPTPPPLATLEILKCAKPCTVLDSCGGGVPSTPKVTPPPPEPVIEERKPSTIPKSGCPGPCAISKKPKQTSFSVISPPPVPEPETPAPETPEVEPEPSEPESERSEPEPKPSEPEPEPSEPEPEPPEPEPSEPDEAEPSEAEPEHPEHELVIEERKLSTSAKPECSAPCAISKKPTLSVIAPPLSPIPAQSLTDKALKCAAPCKISKTCDGRDTSIIRSSILEVAEEIECNPSLETQSFEIQPRELNAFSGTTTQIESLMVRPTVSDFLIKDDDSEWRMEDWDRFGLFIASECKLMPKQKGKQFKNKCLELIIEYSQN